MKTLSLGVILVLALGLAVTNLLPLWASDTDGTIALIEVEQLKNKLNQEKAAQEQAAKKQAEIQEKAAKEGATKAAYAESRNARIKTIEKARGKKVKSWQVLNR